MKICEIREIKFPRKFCFIEIREIKFPRKMDFFPTREIKFPRKFLTLTLFGMGFFMYAKGMGGGKNYPPPP